MVAKFTAKIPELDSNDYVTKYQDEVSRSVGHSLYTRFWSLYYTVLTTNLNAGDLTKIFFGNFCTLFPKPNDTEINEMMKPTLTNGLRILEKPYSGVATKKNRQGSENFKQKFPKYTLNSIWTVGSIN